MILHIFIFYILHVQHGGPATPRPGIPCSGALNAVCCELIFDRANTAADHFWTVGARKSPCKF